MQETQFRKSAIDAPDCINAGLALIKPNYWLFFGMVAVELLILFAVDYVPYIGGLLNTAVSGALACGIYMAMLEEARGQRPEFSLMFEGFSRIFPAFAVSLVPVIPWFFLSLSVVLFAPSFGIDIEALKQLSPSQPNLDFLKNLTAAFYLCVFVAFLLSFALNLLIYFTLQLIADKNLGALDAIKLSVRAGLGNFGGLFFLLFLEGLLTLGGFLVCIVGFFFVLPVIYAANVVAYQRVFPDLSSAEPTEPPTPEFYRHEL